MDGLQIRWRIARIAIQLEHVRSKRLRRHVDAMIVPNLSTKFVGRNRHHNQARSWPVAQFP